MKNLVLTLTCLLISLAVSSQNIIIGNVYDDNNDPIFFATVALYNIQDSSIVKAESTDEYGKFSFKNIDDGEYYLEASMLSYTNQKTANISLPSTNPINLDITLSTDATLLSTIEIKDRAPLLEQKSDRLIVNVENNITNTGGNLLDVMKKVPGMLVVNDRLSLAGSGSPTILLNGKSTQYMDVESLLKDMPGDNIKKVEIIHQPGAEFEATGTGPIINIIMKKNSLFGTNGSFNVGVGKGRLWDYNTGLNLSHYEGKFNINGGIGFSRNSWVEEIELTRRLTGNGSEFDGTYIQSNDDSGTPKTWRGNLRMDYDLTDKHRIGLESKIYDNTANRVATNITNIDLTDVNQQDYKLDTENDISNSWKYYAINPYYIFEMDTAGQKLEFDVNVANYSVGGFNTLTTTNDINADIDRQRYSQPGDTDIFASTVDYTKPLSKIVDFKIGGKYSMADLDNDLLSEFQDDGQNWSTNFSQSNHYLFSERIYAAYSKLSFSKGDWSGTAGLRYENSKSIGESLTLDSTLTRDISKFFPSFSLSKKLSKVLTSTVSYSYRINRPRYSTLNPFVYYLDPFTYTRGNPNLRPELTHSSKFTLSFEGQPFFNIEYKKSKDAMVEVTEQVRNSSEALKTEVNFDGQEQFSTSLFFPLDFIPGISGYGGVIQSRIAYNSFYNDGQFDRSKWNTTAFIQINFTLPAEINAELGGWYTSSNQEGIFNSEFLYGSSFGLSKKFLDNKAKISIGIEDFVNRFWYADVDYQQDMDLLVKWQAPVVNAKFSYKFGNQHLKSKQKRSGSASEEIRRAQQGN